MSGNSTSVAGPGPLGNGSGYRIGDHLVLTAGHVAYEFNGNWNNIGLTGLNVVLDYRGYAQAYIDYLHNHAADTPHPDAAHVEGHITPQDSVLINQGGNVNQGDDGLVLFMNPDDMLTLSFRVAGTKIYREVVFWYRPRTRCTCF